MARPRMCVCVVFVIELTMRQGVRVVLFFGNGPVSCDWVWREVIFVFISHLCPVSHICLVQNLPVHTYLLGSRSPLTIGLGTA